MRKKSKREKKHREGEIPTGSFSDIAFLLIIYFIIATTLVKVKSITADMPAGEKSAQSQSDKTPIVNLRGQEIFLNDKPVDLAGLNERLAALELFDKDPKDRVIMLESARGTAYGNYYQAMASISTNGGVIALVKEDEK
ncbi:MAG: ExbD/TolR family protein [Luteolibacter sp.]